MSTTFTKHTIGDAYNFSIVGSINQERGLSVREFIQPDISCPFINNQPVVFIMDFGIPGSIEKPYSSGQK